MFNRTDDTDDAPKSGATPAPEHIAFDAEILSIDEDSTECTIYPTDVSEIERTTHWITAADDSFVSLAECR